MKVVIPIKGLEQAKQRLSPLLSGPERRQLMKHMIDDVLATVTQAEGVTGLIVITDDIDAREQVSKYDARILSETVHSPAGGDEKGTSQIRVSGVEQLNQLFAMAMKTLAEEGEEGILLLPADVPLISVDDIAQMLSQHDNPGVTIVPASADGGTNALMVSPPQLITPGFGHQSARRHCELSHAKGIEPKVVCGLDLGLDVDTVDDLQQLMTAPVRSRTQRYLLDSDIMKRIEAQHFKVKDANTVEQDGRQAG